MSPLHAPRSAFPLVEPDARPAPSMPLSPASPEADSAAVPSDTEEASPSTSAARQPPMSSLLLDQCSPTPSLPSSELEGSPPLLQRGPPSKSFTDTPRRGTAPEVTPVCVAGELSTPSPAPAPGHPSSGSLAGHPSGGSIDSAGSSSASGAIAAGPETKEFRTDFAEMLASATHTAP